MVRIDPRTFEANLAEAEANQKANRSNLDFINKQLTRLQSLFDDGFVGEEALDEAISRRDQTLRYYCPPGSHYPDAQTGTGTNTNYRPF